MSGFLGGLAARRGTPAVQVAAGAQLVGLVAVVALLAALRPSWPGLVELLPALAGGLAGGLGLAALFRALSVGRMTVTAPIASTGVGVPIVASFLLGELPTPLQAAGVVLAVAGVLVASHDSRRREAGSTRGTQGIGLAVVAAILFGLFYVGLDQSADAGVLWTVVAARTLSVAFLLLWVAYAFGYSRGGPARGQRVRIAASGGLDVAANAAFTWATTAGALVLAAVPAALYPVVTLLCAHLFLRERVRPRQRLGAALALLGVACMAVPK